MEVIREKAKKARTKIHRCILIKFAFVTILTLHPGTVQYFGLGLPFLVVDLGVRNALAQWPQ